MDDALGDANLLGDPYCTRMVARVCFSTNFEHTLCKGQSKRNVLCRDVPFDPSRKHRRHQLSHDNMMLSVILTALSWLLVFLNKLSNTRFARFSFPFFLLFGF